MDVTQGTDSLSLLLYLVVVVISPFLVDIVTKRLASTQVKTATLLAINLLTGVVVGFANAHNNHLDYDWKSALVAAGFAFIGGSASVFGLKSINLVGAQGPLATNGGIGKVDTVKAVKEQTGKDVAVITPVADVSDPNTPVVVDPGTDAANPQV